ncbi:MAG TPA: triphosphoribosyl-dephospho-CoA synthase CitG [Sulfurospirillum arcachonense]|nr:triphosphoribosyl-dephospho-CoA synthase CitG [Sulfurospirillum arcachonense]HIP44730.1 triphosphoribosyl-dephospho-CoA synthase CitG [Sulfurospirillum arcachonense]
MITNLAYKALIKEVELTPKPGLVDRTNNGSHKDMNIDTFYASAKAIKPFIKKFLHVSEFDELRLVGLECEKAMFKATNGVNTHKGMIFSLAVICGAINRAESFENLQDEIKFLCKDLVKNDLEKSLHVETHGEKFYNEVKHTGIRGEAVSGYATVFEKSLPFYVEQFKNYGEERAMKLTLLFLMSITDDSTLYARGGLEGLKFIKKEAKKVLHVENLDNNLLELDKMMIKRNLSSGGSADLLGLTWFLYQLKEIKWNF